MITRRLAALAASLREEDLDAAGVLDQTRRLTLDLAGTSIFVAHRTPWGRLISAVATEELAGQPVAAVLGTGGRTSSSSAALANGTLALGFEYEDTHPLGGHPFAIAFPAALAVGQWQHLRGLEVLTAAAAGYEVETRLRRGLRPDRNAWPDRGLYPVTMFGVYGAAAAAGRALRLSAQQMANALGIAGSQAFGTMQAHAEGTMARRLNGGRAAETGVTAAVLAARGFTGPTQIVEGEYGFFKVFAEATNDEAVTEGLSASGAGLPASGLMMEKAWLKNYPVNGLFQAPIDALRAMQEAHRFQPEEVAHIEATIGRASRMHAEREGRSAVRAQFSLPISLALTLRDGSPKPAVLLRETVEEAVMRLADRINVSFDPRIPEGHPDATRLGRVTVTLNDGRRLHHEVLYPKGHPRNPMGWEEVRRKFDDLLDWVPPGHRDRLAETFGEFDRLSDVAGVDGAIGRSPA